MELHRTHNGYHITFVIPDKIEQFFIEQGIGKELFLDDHYWFEVVLMEYVDENDKKEFNIQIYGVLTGLSPEKGFEVLHKFEMNDIIVEGSYNWESKCIIKYRILKS